MGLWSLGFRVELRVELQGSRVYKGSKYWFMVYGINIRAVLGSVNLSDVTQRFKTSQKP